MKTLTQHIKRILCNGGLFCLIFFLTYKVFFSKINFHELKNILGHIEIKYLICALLSALAVVFLEALVIKRNLRLLGENVKYRNCITYAFSGNFFSAITPAATGGQPAQLYFMSKDNVPVTKGILALFMDLGAYQASIVTLAVIGYTTCFAMINKSLGKFLPLLWIGIFINIALLIFTLVAIFSKNLVGNIVRGILKIVAKVAPKKVGGIEAKANESIKKFRACADILKRNKKDYILNSVFTFIRIIFMHMAPYWVYKCFGLSGQTIITLISLQAALYISCASLPLPGTIGVGESVFMLFFKGVFASKVIGGAMLISRSVSVYFTVTFCGALLGLIFITSKAREMNKKEVEAI